VSERLAPEALYDAGAAIDRLLASEDSDLLASMAWFRANMVSMFGRDGCIAMLLEELARSACVHHFSARSEREINRARPMIRVRVDDAAAAIAHPKALRVAGFRSADLGYGRTPREFGKILSFKSQVIFAEVCQPVAQRMNEALLPHWPAAKAYLVARGARPELVKMFVSSMFGVSVANDPAVHSRDRMAILSFFI
jgi:hypothetical protein